MSTFRERGLSYLIVGPFAIVLAFPFYWMLMTMFKEDSDLYDVNHVPYVYNPLQWKFWESATTKHVSFIFEETNYPTWLLNTAIVGGLVVLITLVVAAPAGATSETPANGTVSFVDNVVDQATDTIRLKASFPNRDRRFWAGAFVDVTLELSVDPRAIVVPNASVQASQQGQFVYVVKTDETVEARPVKVAWVDGDDAVIESGLQAGETVVTDGQLRLVPGARVSVKPAETQPRTTS